MVAAVGCPAAAVGWAAAAVVAVNCWWMPHQVHVQIADVAALKVMPHLGKKSRQPKKKKKRGLMLVSECVLLLWKKKKSGKKKRKKGVPGLN